MAPSDGLGTHTPIRFGQAITRARGSYHMRDFVVDEPVTNDRHLLYMFYRQVSGFWHGFLMVQAARRSGKFTIEMGLALHKRYPLYDGRVQPSFILDGVRERLGALQNQDDHWWEYRLQDQLDRTLRELLDRAAATVFNHLYERYGATLVRESKRVQDLVNQWEADEAAFGDRPLGARFAGLALEPRAYHYALRMAGDPRMRAVLGDLQPRFSDERWLSCLVYCLASLLQSEDPQEMSRNICAPAVVDDEAMTLCGRAPFYLYLDQADNYDERVDRHCFFKALNMVEAQYEPSDRLSLQTGVVTTNMRFDRP